MITNLGFDKNKVFIFSDRPRLSRLVSEMRHKGLQKFPHEFRTRAAEIGYLLAYEIEHRESFATTTNEIPTTLGMAEHCFRKEDPIILNVLRAANPMVDGTLGIFRESPVAFLDAKRKEGTYDDITGKIDVEITYANVPVKSFKDRVLLIPDIMLATGSSLVASCEQLFEKYGSPKQVVVSSIIAVPQGIDTVLEKIENSKVYTAAVDSELNEKAYIIPGLGDAGDLCYNGRD